jgi:hypothetical protein
MNVKKQPNTVVNICHNTQLLFLEGLLSPTEKVDDLVFR